MKKILFVLVVLCYSSFLMAQQAIKIDEFVDNKIVCSYIYQKQISKVIVFDEKEKKTGVTFYKNNKPYNVKDRTDKLDLEERAKDLKVQLTYLKNKKIQIGYPETIESEIKEISKILSVADNYSDFQSFDVTSENNSRTIKLINFNKRIYFKNSDIEEFLHPGTMIINYTLEINGGRLVREIYDLETGQLERVYYYNQRNDLVRVLYSMQTKDKKFYSKEKRFVYRLSCKNIKLN